MGKGVGYSWNPVLNLVREIKLEFIKKFGGLFTIDFGTWLELLDNDKYNDIFEPLQFNQSGNFLLIRYGLSDVQKGLWEDPNSIYRECRSVVIDLDKEQLVIAPFRKFFNLDEVEENKLSKIQDKFLTAKHLYVVDKLDGSMQTARYYDGEVRLFSSKALTDKDSWRLEAGRDLLTKQYTDMIKSLPNITFIFEYVSPSNLHVVPYKKRDEGMYLIGARDVDTGEHYDPGTINLLAIIHGIKTPKIEDRTLDELLTLMKEAPSTEREGWVINLDGHMLKIKCDDYVNIHKALDNASSVNVIIQSVAEDTFDDLISKVPFENRERLYTIHDMVVRYINKTKEDISYWYKRAPKSDRKTFMIYVDKAVPKNIRKYVRKEYLGEDYNLLHKRHNSYKRMRDLGYSERDIAKELGGVDLE